MNFSVQFTKNKIPCMWESGFSNKNEGYARLITNQNGLPKIPILIKSNIYSHSNDHALLPATEKSHVLEVKRNNHSYKIDIYRINNIQGDQAQTELLYSYNNGQWSREPDMKFYDAIQQGIKKSNDEHSFAPYYVLE